MEYGVIYCTHPQALRSLVPREVNAVRHWRRVVTSTYYYLRAYLLCRILHQAVEHQLHMHGVPN